MNTTISERYELGDRLGSGGMSTVYKATDRVLERTVAVKILAEHLSDDDKFVARFRREALAVAKLIHPNIVQVYDTGVDNYRHYIVMEYVEGKSVAQLLQTQGPARRRGGGRDRHPVLRRARVRPPTGDHPPRRQAREPDGDRRAGGPAAARQLRPRASDRRDDGQAHRLRHRPGRAQTRLTQVGSVVGTAAYLAPEQARGEEATPAADVYALGVCLYQLLTGRLPWEGSTLAELANRRENESALPPSSYDPDVPETLSVAVLRSLEGDASARYSSARELSRALEAGLRGEEPAPASDELPTDMLAGSAGTVATRAHGRRPADPDLSRPVLPARPAPPPAPAPRPTAAPRAPRRSAPAVPLLPRDRRPAADRDPRRDHRRGRAPAHRRGPAHRHRRDDQGQPNDQIQAIKDLVEGNE